MSIFTGHCLALSGGVGGAKLALGLSHELAPDQLSIIANTADDFEHLGLKICPDIDTLMYTLSGLANKAQGWGQQDETWEFLTALARLGGENWFQLGDRDLATHVRRRQLLSEGKCLSEVTAELFKALGIEHAVYPMSDDEVSTQVQLQSGESLSFQHYFVRERCQPPIKGFNFNGIAQAQIGAGFEHALNRQDLACVLICPSNPFVSVDPILHLPKVKTILGANTAPVIAVSPIVGGIAIKGPAAKMMAELGMPQTALSIAKHYQGLVDGLVIDHTDSAHAEAIEALGMAVHVTGTVMNSLDDRIRLASQCLAFANELN